jgi:hypothetical protein
MSEYLKTSNIDKIFVRGTTPKMETPYKLLMELCSLLNEHEENIKKIATQDTKIKIYEETIKKQEEIMKKYVGTLKNKAK